MNISNLIHVLGLWAWWRHQMEIFSALLALCAGNSPVSGEFPTQRPVTRSFDIFSDLRLNKLLSKHWWGRWFETPSHPLWRHCNGVAAGRALGAVISKFKMLKSVGYVTFKKMYDADVETVYEYNSCVWVYIKSKDFYMVQNRAMRYLIPWCSQMCTYMWYNSWYGLDKLRLEHNPLHDSLLEPICWYEKYKMYVKLRFRRKFWMGAELKSGFNELDMGDVFVNRMLCDLDYVNKMTMELTTVKWTDDIVREPKLGTSFNFKDALNPENYAMLIINRQKSDPVENVDIANQIKHRSI